MILMKNSNGGKVMAVKRIMRISMLLSAVLFVVVITLAFFNVQLFAQEPGAEKTAGKPPLGLASIGAGIAIGLSALASGLAQSKIGSAGAGALVEKPELFGNILILTVIPETMVVFGFVIAIMMVI
jgi:V/A-type H+/Na+-transporting ATPase subunit K